jgi:hypothetical protein
MVAMEVVVLGLLTVRAKVTYLNCTCNTKMHTYASMICRIILLFDNKKLIHGLTLQVLEKGSQLLRTLLNYKMILPFHLLTYTTTALL